MGDNSETQSQVGWLMEVIVCVSLKLSPAIGADTGRSDYFTQANNCSLAVYRILHDHIVAQCRCLNLVLSFNISIIQFLYWYQQLMTMGVYAMI
jgi:hypothetical protein